jgi:transcriptional regulator with XRE-family HTH domain
MFGEKIYVSQDVINNLERGRVTPTEYHIKGICERLNVNETWLRTGEGEMFNPVNTSLDALAEAHNINGLTRAIIEGLITMKPEHQAAFIDLIDTVAAKVRNAEYEQVTAEHLAKTMLSDFTSSKAKGAQEPADPSEPQTV